MRNGSNAPEFRLRKECRCRHLVIQAFDDRKNEYSDTADAYMDRPASIAANTKTYALTPKPGVSTADPAWDRLRSWFASTGRGLI